MIATISKRGGRRYPSLGAMLWAMWLPSFGTTAAPPVVGPTPEERRAYVDAEVRTARVLLDNRSAFIPADDRRARVLR